MSLRSTCLPLSPGRFCLAFVLVFVASAAGCGAPDAARDAGAEPGTDAASACDGSSCAEARSCEDDEACDDGRFCTGVERCEAGRCAAGDPVDCDDAIACTTDACDDEAAVCTHAAPDEDGDGHGAASCTDAQGEALGDDCDDRDALRFPGALEVCDLGDRDEDCDPTTYGTQDGDGDGEDAASCCNVDADGAKHCGTDCDDTRIAVRSKQPEFCDDRDNDCDGEVDEEAGAVTWYLDRDLDGFGFDLEGDDDDVVSSCIPVPAHSLLGTDCDDSNPALSPREREFCDGVDNDCSGFIDDDPKCGDPGGTPVNPMTNPGGVTPQTGTLVDKFLTPHSADNLSDLVPDGAYLRYLPGGERQVAAAAVVVPQADKVVASWTFDGTVGASPSGPVLSAIGGFALDVPAGHPAPAEPRTYVEGQLSGALHFAGFHMATTPQAAFDLDVFTVCAWVKAAPSVLSDGDDNVVVGAQRFRLALGPGGVAYFAVNQGAAAYAGLSHAIEPNRWMHLCGRVDVNDNQGVYLNGVWDGVASEPYAAAGVPQAVHVGAAWEDGNTPPAHSDQVQADIDEVTIWSTALTTQEIYALYNAQRGDYQVSVPGVLRSQIFDAGAVVQWTALRPRMQAPAGKPVPADALRETAYAADALDASGALALYRFEQSGANTSFQDSSLRGLHLSAAARASVPGRIGRGARFAASGAPMAVLTAPAALTQLTRVSVAGWIRNEGIFANGTLLERVGAYALRFDGAFGTAVAQVNVGSLAAPVVWSAFTTTHPAPEEQWNHLAMTHDGTYLRLYINGALTSSVLAVGAVNTESADVQVGSFSDEAAWLDELSVWDRTLSDAEVAALYGRGVRQARFTVRACQMPSCADATFTSTTALGYYSEALAPTSAQPSWSLLDLPRSRYFQYEMVLSSGDSRTTPLITDVRVDYRR